jgi:hypothetical protein
MAPLLFGGASCGGVTRPWRFPSVIAPSRPRASFSRLLAFVRARALLEQGSGLDLVSAAGVLSWLRCSMPGMPRGFASGILRESCGAGHEIWKRKLVHIGVWEITRICWSWRFGCCNTMARSETAGDFERLTVDCCHDSLLDADN